jgi:hypothetical protein
MMNTDEFKKQLASVTPDVPEHFHNRVEMTLENIVLQEAQMKESTKQAIKTAGRFSGRTLVIAITLVVMIAAAALAATQWNLFGQLPHLAGESPVNADSVMQKDLHTETVNNVEISIKEAGYDGRTLLIQRSYRMLDANEAFGSKGLRWENEEKLYKDYHVGWWIDHIWFNGKCMDMPGGSESMITGSDVPGEIIITEAWRLYEEGVYLEGPTEISMPIGEIQDIDNYYHHPEKKDADGNLLVPDKGMVTFTFDPGDVQSRVKTFHPEQEAVLPELTAKTADATFTPLMTYITLDIKVNPEAMAALAAKDGESSPAEDGEPLWEYDDEEMYVLGPWVMSLALVDGNGNIMFPDHDGMDGYGADIAKFLYPYLENIPDELWMAPVDEETGGVDMSRAVLVKPANE